MDNKERCQSRGMAVSKEFRNYETNADGSIVSEYCQFCYQNGGFRTAGLCRFVPSAGRSSG